MRLHVPPGHPYSPIPSAQDIARTRDVNAAEVLPIPGVDLRLEQQWELLAELLPLYDEVAELLREAPRFRLDNTWFAGSDAVFMALMLRHRQPARIVEVGCGYSSALMSDVHPQASTTFIDPDPARLRSLLGPDAHVLDRPVQDVDPEVFTSLAAGDVLAIDSSHVLRAGSDVAHLIFDVIPQLAEGVLIHVHDIFFPFEYPRSWLDDGVAFSEAYAWHAALLNASSPRIELWNHLLITSDRRWFEKNMPLCLSAPFLTGGLWLCT